jgi:hypothetical protein
MKSTTMVTTERVVIMRKPSAHITKSFVVLSCKYCVFSMYRVLLSVWCSMMLENSKMCWVKEPSRVEDDFESKAFNEKSITSETLIYFENNWNFIGKQFLSNHLTKLITAFDSCCSLKLNKFWIIGFSETMTRSLMSHIFWLGKTFFLVTRP